MYIRVAMGRTEEIAALAVEASQPHPPLAGGAPFRTVAHFHVNIFA